MNVWQCRNLTARLAPGGKPAHARLELPPPLMLWLKTQRVRWAVNQSLVAGDAPRNSCCTLSSNPLDSQPNDSPLTPEKDDQA